MTASAVLADECAIYESAPAAFSGQDLSATHSPSLDATVYMLSYPAVPAWWNSVKSQLDELGRLPPGWDSYAAKVITASSRSTALDVLRQIATRKTPKPAIVPTSDGSIQVEWHTRGIDLEVRVLSSTRIGVSFEDEQNQLGPIDDEFQYDFRPLVLAMSILSSR